MKFKVRHIKAKGFAMAVTLIIFAILFILSASYLSSIEYDARFTRLQQAGIQAIYLAQSGKEYYRVTDSKGEVKIDNNKIMIEDYPGKSGFLKITGIIYSAPDKEIARQTIVVPIGRWNEWHRE